MKQMRYVIIGAGMAGILAGIKLLQRGETNFVILEKTGALGGTWRDNRYPGLTCDVPAHAYTYSFAPNPEWSSYYVGGPEIRRYFEKVAADYGVMPFIRFNSEVTSCVFDEAAATWTVRTGDGSEEIADILIAASGVLHHPKTPDIPGLDSFKGHAFHSARWDDSAPLDNARVGIVGCGSTGVQILTALTGRAKQVVALQRSPQWVMPVPQFDYSDAEREAFRKDVKLIDEIRYNKDYWAAIIRFTDGITNIDGPEMAEIEDLCRQHLETSIADPALREKLRPNYRAACKRLIYSWCYFDHVQKPNVYVETGGIAQVEPEGVRMQDGTFHPLDTLVLATGFHANRFIRPASVIGRGGKTLDDAWATRPTAYYAVAVPEFPNFFLLNGPTGPVGNFSLIDIAEAQWTYVAQLIDRLKDGNAKAVEPTHEAMASYEDRRIAAAKRTIFGSGCTSWYLDETGVPSSWPWSYKDFVTAMEKPNYEDYRFAA